VGRWPCGPGFEVYGNSSDNILCFGSGSGVLVFDITDPSNPVRLSQIAVNGLIMQIYLRDTLLFVSSYGNGIEVFNLANPSNPVKVSQISVPARDFCLKDTFAYCVAEDSLRIINIADILNPFQVGTCEDSGYVVSVSGNYAFTGGRWKLSAIDVTNPANPQVVNSLGVWVYTLTCDGNHCYCVLNTNGFTIYNISDPLNIWQESQLNTVGGVDIYKLDFYVYLPGFVIVDVGDSANPFVVGDTSLPVYAQAVWVNNNFGYLTPININDPTNPSALNSIYGADDSRDVFVLGNYAYVSNDRKGLKILDITVPTNPFEVGEYDTVGPSPYLEALWVRDSIAYISAYSSVGWPSRFRTVNINNPSSPVLIGECNLYDVGGDMVVRDSLAYALSSGRAFQIVRVFNPAMPETISSYILPDGTSAMSLFLQDSFAYIAHGDSGLRILNISDPAAPFEVGHYDNPPGGGATGIFVKDTLAYFATWGGGLRILNVTDPSSPFEIGFHSNAAWDVIVKDTIAYVSSNLGYFNVINVADPANPVLIGYYENPHYAYNLFIDSTLVYVVCHEAGVSILEWDDTGIEESGRDKFVWSDVEFRLRPTVTQRNINLFIHSVSEQEYDLVIYDESGRKIMDILCKKTLQGGLKKRINLSNMSNGVYFVVLKTEGKKFVQKFVVIH
jgi:hypothetical protein